MVRLQEVSYETTLYSRRTTIYSYSIISDTRRPPLLLAAKAMTMTDVLFFVLNEERSERNVRLLPEHRFSAT
jgi:hypothetical protein